MGTLRTLILPLEQFEFETPGVHETCDLLVRGNPTAVNEDIIAR